MSTLSRDYENGRVVSIDVRILGNVLAVDAAGGASTITVEDSIEFDEAGGQLLLNGIVYGYSTKDDATDVITLAGTLNAAAVEGDEVAVYSPTYQAAASEKVAQVALLGEHGNTDTIQATVALHLVDKLAEGIRGGQGEAVKLELTGNGWELIDVLGQSEKPNSVSGARDSSVATTVGAGVNQFIILSHEPIPNTEHVRWGGHDLLDSEWSRVGRVITIPDPDGIAHLEDIFTCKYLSNDGAEEPSLLLIGATGLGPGTLVNGWNSLPLPTGTESGDIIVVAICSHAADVAADSRMFGRWPSGIIPGDTMPWGYIAAGIADSSSADVDIYVDSGFGMRAASIATFRGGNVGSVRSDMHEPVADGGFTFAAPSKGALGICASITKNGVVADGADTPTQTGTTWADAVQLESSTRGTRISYTTDLAPSFPSKDITIAGYASGSSVDVLLIGIS